MEYEFHELANIFPMMNEQETEDLINSIKENGQRDDIWLWQGKIIDGRNRYLACKKLGIEPNVKEWDGIGSLLDFVKDKNLTRRQLEPSQRAMVAARMKPLYEEEAKQRQATSTGGANPQLKPRGAEAEQSIKGTTNEIVGAMMKVSKGSVQRASKVIKDGTEELQKAVDNGKVSVRKAAEIATLPKEEQPDALQNVLEDKKEQRLIVPEVIENRDVSRVIKNIEEMRNNIQHTIPKLVESIQKSKNQIEIQCDVSSLLNFLHFKEREIINSLNNKDSNILSLVNGMVYISSDIAHILLNENISTYSESEIQVAIRSLEDATKRIKKLAHYKKTKNVQPVSSVI